MFHPKIGHHDPLYHIPLPVVILHYPKQTKLNNNFIFYWIPRLCRRYIYVNTNTQIHN